MRNLAWLFLCASGFSCAKPRTMGMMPRQSLTQILECRRSFSQSQSSTGELRVEVTTPKGAPIPGVIIKLTRLDTRTTQSPGLEADDQGKGRFESLQSGTYELHAFMDGFQTVFISSVAIPSQGCIQQTIVMKPDHTETGCDVGPNGIDFCSSSSITHIPVDLYRELFAW